MSTNQSAVDSRQSSEAGSRQSSERRGSIEARLTDFIAGLVPWIAPIPSAVLVANATMRYLGWGEPVAIVAGLIIEGLGLTSTSTALTLWEWNQRKPEGEPAAPFWLAGLLVAVYLISTIGLTVVLAMDTELVRIAPAIFPILAVVGTVNIALRAQHKHRLARISNEHLERQADEAARKAERKAERTERESRRQQSVQKLSGEPSGDSKLDSWTTRMLMSRRQKHDAQLQALVDTLRQYGDIGPTELGRTIGTSRSTVYTYLGELEQAGRVHKNGNGWEVK